jgi:L-threonylcarbamoyladenylate synthase
MNTEVLRVDPAAPDPAALGRAAAGLRAGRLVAFPTETVYGLGANALDPAAVGRIFEAKGRPTSNPLIVHVADPAQVRNVATDWPATAERLAARFWPGPLTLVLPKAVNVPDEVTAGGPTVAVRCPAHPVARELIRAAGVPVAAPSANRSTELSPTRAEHVLKGLGGRIDLILDGGSCPGGIESTVVDVTGPAVRLLRPGLVTASMLEEVVGPLATGAAAGGVARSPGQMARHYSPRTPLVLVEGGNPWPILATLRLSGRLAELLRLSDDPERAAAELYDSLHQLDEQRCDVVVASLPPDTPEWAAVRDRLTRAAAND